MLIAGAVYFCASAERDVARSIETSTRGILWYNALPCGKQTTPKILPWPESASELYRPRDRRLSAKLVPTYVDIGCLVVSVTDPFGSILSFLDRSLYFFFQATPQMYSRDWVDLRQTTRRNIFNLWISAVFKECYSASETARHFFQNSRGIQREHCIAVTEHWNKPQNWAHILFYIMKSEDRV
jgi:hypothetical protein